MGYFYDRRNPSPPHWAIVKLNPTLLTGLGCMKSPEDFFADFVKRGPAVQGLVFINFVEPASPATGGKAELTLEFTEMSDLTALAAGASHQWLDCCTQFASITPVASSTIHLIMTVAQPSAAPPAALAVSASLLA